MSGNRNSNFSESESTCVVCFKIVDAFSLGVCDHPVCFECSTRMRVLCNQIECPICRREMPTVIFTKEIEPFSILRRVENQKLYEQKYGIYFATPSLQRRYYHLLDHECFICRRNPNNLPFKTFQHLKDHMRRAHELFYCELCVINLKIFTFERKCYTRVELATHRRKGDADNTSHRGHPLCEFCDTRFMDNDELFRHLRRDHLFCHFCDTDGKHQYYDTYDDLRRHYLDEHYLCEEGDCKHERFTSAFRTDIDLKAHYAAVHSKNLSKAANRQARTLELEFTLAPRERPVATSARGGRNYGPRYADRNKDNNNTNSESSSVEPGRPEGGTQEGQVFSNPLASANFPSLGNDANNTLHTISNVTITSKMNPLSEENFPSLGGGAVNSKQPLVTITRTTVRGLQHGVQRNIADFPALGETTSSSSVRLSVNNNKKDQTSSAKSPNMSIHVNHKSSGEITTRINQPSSSNGHSLSVRPKTVSEAFPSLSTGVKVAQPLWVQPKSKKQHESNKESKVASAPHLPTSSLNDFPTLSKNGKGDSKKMASSSVWVNLNNFNSNTVPKKNKLVAKSSKTIDLVSSSTTNNVSESNDIKSKNNKKKKIKINTSANNDLANSVNKMDLNTSLDDEKKHMPNGVIKKRSELNVEVSEPDTVVGFVNEVMSTNNSTKPPPGFKLKPPPGLNNFPLANNDLVFTSSSGQTYQITAQHFFPPPNFKIRNQHLIEKFKMLRQNPDAVQQFKIQSDMFRSGEIQADKYYEYCKNLMCNEFDTLFPELLVLLPNIQRQQDLYTVYKDQCEPKDLEVCATCYQIVLKSDLRNHLSNHALDNHFPVLNHTTDDNTAWHTK